ncbi:uncharacterized protein ARB_03023 [Trichophyton benhamiae CBS 112371]|uniref:Uncharacterized protein n=1 Tax=Arthroderma benhamiae (strain ATCC MYA-4681 / CBS 112371) TaxID=663331 RepID=D4B3I4_ARTBC|nr:uncharacterized protein ARB_03023 [Trichophyton benhamiae CBS 112371]EFE29682.1 hypothetical protein ARB_03023 [Trichophyton benhamiae CBS 112371]
MAQVHMAHQLLERAHPPETAEQLFADKVKHRPLFLRPTSPTPSDNRSRRRMQRIRKKEYFLRKQKPKPLSAREKRDLEVHKLPKEEMKYEIFKGLNQLWTEYMWQVLDLVPRSTSDSTGKTPTPAMEKSNRISAASHGSKLASADFHGADIQVLTWFYRDLAIPKEHTIFRFEIPPPSDPNTEARTGFEAKNFVFEIHGNQFENRAPERANKKFKWKNLDYL